MSRDGAQSTQATEDRTRRQKKRWADLSPGERAAIVLGAIAELILTTIALRDLARRPREEVRGSKPAWVLACFVQPIGPILYFLVGRRRPPTPRPCTTGWPIWTKNTAGSRTNQPFRACL
jgi:hypothetical protein